MLANLLSRSILLVLLSTLGISSMHAHGIALIKESGELLELSESHVHVKIDNQISIVTSTQIFINKTGEDINIKYGFPLQFNANPIGLRWKLDSGEWKDAVVNSETQDPNLPDTSGGSGSGTASGSDLDKYLGVNPLFFSPGDTITKGMQLTLEITYVELLEYSFGEVSFSYPYDYSLIQFDALERQSFELEFVSERTIDQFSFVGIDDIVIDRQDKEISATYSEEYDRAKDDIHITYQLSSEELGLTFLSTFIEGGSACDTFGEGFVSMIIEPESNEDVDIIEKRFTLVIDRSGSMSGNKIIQARSAAEFIVNNLNPGDYFNIISFSSNVTSAFDEHKLVSRPTRSAALEFIDNISAAGSTNISGSLSQAISEFDVQDDTKANIIIFFTDGVATSGLTNTSEIINAVDQQVNTAETGIFLFTFGVGNDVDKQLLTLLAAENRGLASFLENEDLEEEITRFFLQINNPVLIDIIMTMTPDLITELYPSKTALPNLYKGEQLIVSGRYEQADTIMVKLNGKAYNLDVEYEFPIILADTVDVEKSFLPKIWAKQKLDDLTIDFYLANDDMEAQRIQDEIDTLSLCYQVVSLEFNSFSDGAVLEIDELSYEVRVTNDNQVSVEWSTSMELNNDYFIVQRSTDAKEWTDLARIDGAGSTQEVQHYSYIDKAPLKGVSYYRYVQVDYTGEIYPSEIRVVNIAGEAEILLFPNPVPQGQLLQIVSGTTETLNVIISDINGRQVLVDILAGGNGIVELEQLPKGTYICQIKGDTITKNYKIIVE